MSDTILQRLAAESTSEDIAPWIVAARNGNDIHLGELDATTSLAFLQRLLGYSPIRVVALEPERDPEFGVTTNTLVIELPTEVENRLGIFAMDGEVSAAGGFDPELDQGQRYLMFHW